MKPGTVVDRMRLKISTLETELKRLQLENKILREQVKGLAVKVGELVGTAMDLERASS